MSSYWTRNKCSSVANMYSFVDLLFILKTKIAKKNIHFPSMRFPAEVKSKSTIILVHYFRLDVISLHKMIAGDDITKPLAIHYCQTTEGTGMYILMTAIAQRKQGI